MLPAGLLQARRRLQVPGQFVPRWVSDSTQVLDSHRHVSWNGNCVAASIALPELGYDMDKQRPAVADIEQAIRGYLQAHPHAVDTTRGISEWWLRDLRTRPSPGDVATAIARLVAAGEVAPLTLPDGQLAYMAPGSSGFRASSPH
jgi:hypothetical protein